MRNVLDRAEEHGRALAIVQCCTPPGGSIVGSRLDQAWSSGSLRPPLASRGRSLHLTERVVENSGSRRMCATHSSAPPLRARCRIGWDSPSPGTLGLRASHCAVPRFNWPRRNFAGGRRNPSSSFLARSRPFQGELPSETCWPLSWPTGIRDGAGFPPAKRSSSAGAVTDHDKSSLSVRCRPVKR